MNRYEYGDCLPDASSIIEVSHNYIGTSGAPIAQIGNTFVGNIIVESELVEGTAISQYWQTTEGQTLYTVEYDGVSPVVKCYDSNSLVGEIPVPPGESMGIARINGKIVFVMDGLDAFVIKAYADEEPVNVYLKSTGNLLNIRAGYTEQDTFSDLRESLHYTTSLNPQDVWMNTVKMDCPDQVDLRKTLLRCPISTCNTKGSCLAYVEYDKDIGVAGLKCDINGLRLCRYTLGVVNSDDGSGKRLLLIDGSRGYVSDVVTEGALEMLFSEYQVNFGMKFEIVVKPEDREALVAERRVGTYPDLVVLDDSDASQPVLFFYRSISGTLAKVIEVPLSIPTSLGSSRLVSCQLPITMTYRDRDVVDPCISTIFNACTSACSGWINHPQVLENDWKTSFRVQGDILFELREDAVSSPFISLEVNISQHHLTITLDDIHVTTVNESILVGNKITLCSVGDVITVYIDDTAHYRTVAPKPPELYLWVACGTTITHALVDPRINGKMLNQWEGDETFEEVSNCDELKETDEKVIVKDLYCACDTGIIYYREISATLDKGEPIKVFSLEPDVYRAYADIYIENRTTTDAIISIYIAKTSTPYLSNSIGSNIKIQPGDTYIRRAQGIARGESLFVSTSRNDLHLELQTVEETFTR